MLNLSAFGTVTVPAATSNYQLVPPKSGRLSVRVKNTGYQPGTVGPGSDATNGWPLGAGEDVVFTDANSAPGDFIQVSSIFGTTFSFWTTAGE